MLLVNIVTLRILKSNEHRNNAATTTQSIIPTQKHWNVGKIEVH